jgi:hypothetical protein
MKKIFINFFFNIKNKLNFLFYPDLSVLKAIYIHYLFFYPRS